MATPASTELTMTPVNPIEAMTEKPYSLQIDRKMYDLFKLTKAPKLNDAECAMALEMARSMGLNPWANEFYASKGNNGQLLLMVGRDGLLRKAEEFPDYAGYDSGVVHENDEFYREDPDADAKTLRGRAGVVHRQGHPKDRGEIVGAWAVAERRGRPPRYFFAPFSEYRPESPKPGSSWLNNPTAMIEKCPISLVHRTLCNLSGVYLPEEVERAMEMKDGAPAGPSAAETDASIAAIVAELDADAETRDRLLAGIIRMNELSPASWNLAKVQMTLPGQTPEELARVADRIQAEIIAQEALQQPEEKIEDAVVVDEEAENVAAELATLEETIIDLTMAIDDAGSPEEREELQVKLDAAEQRRNELTGAE